MASPANGEDFPASHTIEIPHQRLTKEQIFCLRKTFHGLTSCIQTLLEMQLAKVV